jgi:hypothetical protein
MTLKPRVGLDTSALNRLVKDSAPEPIIAGILAGFDVVLPTMSYEEVLSTRNEELRIKLHNICRRLLTSGICIMPPHWVIDKHVKTFHGNPQGYDWRQVPVRASVIEEEIHRSEFVFDAVLVEQQATELRRLQDEFESFFQRSTVSAGTPKSFADWLALSKQTGGSLWNTTRLLYEGAFGPTSAIDKAVNLASPPEDSTLNTFITACPPVTAVVYALELTLFDRSVRPLNEPSFKAGRNDQLMSVYLPYCDQFLTDDRGQHKSLTEVAEKAGVSVQVRLFDEFSSSFIIGN